MRAARAQPAQMVENMRTIPTRLHQLFDSPQLTTSCPLHNLSYSIIIPCSERANGMNFLVVYTFDLNLKLIDSANKRYTLPYLTIYEMKAIDTKESTYPIVISHTQKTSLLFNSRY